MSANMKAGRSLDALVAEKVMGWPCWLERRGEYAYVLFSRDGKPPWSSSRKEAWPEIKSRCEPWSHDKIDMHKHIVVLDDFRPSTDMSAAWKVVEKMRAANALYSISPSGDSEEPWRVVVWVNGNKSYVYAETFPVCACRAALAAISIPTTPEQRA